MQFRRNLSDNVNYKYFGIMYFEGMFLHLDPFTKLKSNNENDDEIYAMAF